MHKILRYIPQYTRYLDTKIPLKIGYLDIRGVIWGGLGGRRPPPLPKEKEKKKKKKEKKEKREKKRKKWKKKEGNYE